MPPLLRLGALFWGLRLCPAPAEATAPPPENATTAREAFEVFFAKLYAERSNASNASSATSASKSAASSPALDRNCARDLDPKVLADGVDWSKWSDMLDETYDRYAKLMDEGKLARVFVQGGSGKKQIDAAAGYVYERYGGPLVEKVLEKLGAVGGREAGMYVGGELGIVIGLLAPEIALPLAVGGVFLGGRFGSFLGKWGGKIAAQFTNDLIEEKVIDPLAEKGVRSLLEELAKNATGDAGVTCDHKLCGPGSYDHTPQGCNRNCYQCNGMQDFSEHSGAAGGCSQCPKGSVGKAASLQSWDEHDHCSECNKGYGWYEGKGCLYCDGLMEYSDVFGSVGCKACKPGSVGRSSNVVSRWQEHDHCSECSKGYGWYEGKGCVSCDRVSQYQDASGQVGCKDCPGGKTGYDPHHDGGNTECVGATILDTNGTQASVGALYA